MRDVIYGPQGELDWRVWTIERSGIDSGGDERENEVRSTTEEALACGASLMDGVGDLSRKGV